MTRSVEEITAELKLLKEAEAARRRELAEARAREAAAVPRDTLYTFAEQHGEYVKDPRGGEYVFIDGCVWQGAPYEGRWGVPNDTEQGREVRLRNVARFWRIKAQAAEASFNAIRGQLQGRGAFENRLWPGWAGPLPANGEDALGRLKQLYQQFRAEYEKADAAFAACPGEARRRAADEQSRRYHAEQRRFQDWCQTTFNVRLDD